MRIITMLMVVFVFGASLCAYAQEQEGVATPEVREAGPVVERVVETAPGNVTLDFKDADIRNVLRILSYKSGVNIVAGPDVTGLVTIQLIDVPWEQALDVILKTYGYGYETRGNIITVNTLEKIKEQRALEKELAEQEPMATEIYTLNFAKAEEVVVATRDILTPRGRINFDSRTNTVMITDTQTNVEKIMEILPTLDSVTPQVLIEAKIIETNLDNTDRLGINWNASITMTGPKRPHTFPFNRLGTDSILDNEHAPPASSTSIWPTPESTDFSFGTLDASAFQAVLEMIGQRTDTNILSSPRIVTLDNQTASITVGTKWPIASYAYNSQTAQWEVSGFEYHEFGILLKVTPHVNKAGFVTMDIRPEISEQDGSVTFAAAEVPVLTTQETSTRVMIKDGETLVIAGLLKDKVTDTVNKIPILGDIPLFGLLFQHKNKVVEKQDLLIFITPHIITPVISPEA